MHATRLAPCPPQTFTSQVRNQETPALKRDHLKKIRRPSNIFPRIVRHPSLQRTTYHRVGWVERSGTHQSQINHHAKVVGSAFAPPTLRAHDHNTRAPHAPIRSDATQGRGKIEYGVPGICFVFFLVLHNQIKLPANLFRGITGSGNNRLVFIEPAKSLGDGAE